MAVEILFTCKNTDLADLRGSFRQGIAATVSDVWITLKINPRRIQRDSKICIHIVMNALFSEYSQSIDTTINEKTEDPERSLLATLAKVLYIQFN